MASFFRGASEVAAAKGGASKGLKFFDFAFVRVCLRLRAFARVYLRFRSLFREPEICVCLRLRTFARVRLRL